MTDGRRSSGTDDAEREVGRASRRVDGEQFVTGSAEYVDDATLSRELHLEFVQIPRSHAKILDVDASKALEMDGVEAVLTGEGVKARTNPKGHWIQGKDQGDEYGLAVDRVRYYGEPVAAVAAEDKYLAKDAVERVHVDYEPLELVLDADDALSEDAPVIHPEIQHLDQVDGNVSDTVSQRIGDVEAGFEEADHVFEEEFYLPPISHAPLETHGCVADYDTGGGTLALRTSTQVMHTTKNVLSKVLDLPASKIAVEKPEIGGGFGAKLNVAPHEICASLLSMDLGRPVRAKLDRSQLFELTKVSFAYRSSVRMGVRDDGTITAWEEDIVQEEGAYHSWGKAILGILHSRLFPYKVGNIRIDGTVVYTNRVPSCPMRGGRLRQLAVVRESMVALMANELGIDPVEVRKRQMITQEDCPYEAATGALIDSTGMEAAIDAALERIDYEAIKAEIDDESFVGVGVAAGHHHSSTRHATLDADYGSVRLVLESDGSIVLSTDAAEMGNGCRTTLTQIAADACGVETDRITVVDDSTQKTRPGLGSWGSRTMTIHGTATLKAGGSLAEDLKSLAAHHFEASPEDVRLSDGRAHLVGTDLNVDVETLADEAYNAGTDLPEGMTTGSISASVTFDPAMDPDVEHPTEVPNEQGGGHLSVSYPGGFHVVVTSVDPETGKVSVEDYVASDDVGKAINPKIVEGQIHGGVAQALGMALSERITFDEETGQPMNADFSEYGVPTPSEVPDIESIIVEEPSPNTPGGWKGVGEGPLVVGPAAVVNAVCDAVGVRLTELPLDAETVHRAIRDR